MTQSHESFQSGRREFLQAAVAALAAGGFGRAALAEQQEGESGIPTRPLGRTGWEVSEIGFGAWAIGGSWGDVSEADAKATLSAALDAGVSFIDTADVYAAGDCAEIVVPGAERNLLQQVWYTGRMQGRHVAETMLGSEADYDPGIWFNSANHDDDGFPNPWRFDLAREKNDHMAFGRNGPHLCLGAWLARGLGGLAVVGGLGGYVSPASWLILLAVFIAYLLMVAVLSHWGYPLVIMTTVPIGISGGLIGLWLLNAVGGNLDWLGLDPFTQPFDVITMLGFLILIGTVVNNPILIVDRAVRNVDLRNMLPVDAVTEAVEARLRPIAMSTITTLFGLAPLVLIPGAGTELYRGVGAIVMFGILGAALVTLTMLPSLTVMVLERLHRGESTTAQPRPAG